MSTETTQVLRGATPRTNLLLGTALMLAAMVLLPMMDGLAKGLSERYPVPMIVWARYLFHLLCMLPILLWRFGARGLVPKQVGLQVARGSLLLAGTSLFFFALSLLPQATALALFFVSPLVVTVLAPLLLGERVGGWRVLAVLVGFVGIMLILKPGTGAFGLGAALALGAGVLHGFYMLFTRRLAGSAPPLVTLGYTAVVGAVAMSAIAPFVWVRVAPADFAIMVLLGILAAGGHFLLIKAFDHAPATWLAPVGYFEMVTAVIYGYLAYGDLPDTLSWLGILVVVGAGVAISLKEQRTARGLRPGS
ncbi:MAG TPA: DMT family transporter [Trueperaceae bacterium]|nr:DMT family transporter [Trueperaceae bacterium]HRP46562.1 DMT family transporter [Trueperaceae bacterium]